MRFYLQIIGLDLGANESILRKPFLTPMPCRILLVFLSSHFIVSMFTFKSLIHLVGVFKHGNRHMSNIFLLYVNIQFSKHHLIKIHSFIQYMLWVSFSNMRWLYLQVLMSGISILFCGPTCQFSYKYPIGFLLYISIIYLKILNSNTINIVFCLGLFRLSKTFCGFK